MKKKYLSIVAVLVLLSFTTGAFAATNVTAIKAFLNKGIVINIDNAKFQPKNDKKEILYPIVYNGKTYVPIKEFAEDLGAAVKYDSKGDGTYNVTSTAGEDGIPTQDGNSSSGSKTSGSTTSADGSLSSPVPINEKFTWSSTSQLTEKDNKISGTYSCTVKKVTPITKDEIAALGIKNSSSDSRIEYVMVNILWEVKDAKVLINNTGMKSSLSTYWTPNIWGVETADKSWIIGTRDYGFEGSLSSAVSKAGTARLDVGMTESYSAEGKAIIPVYKNDTNYLVLRKSGEKDAEKSKIHFKLK